MDVQARIENDDTLAHRAEQARDRAERALAEMRVATELDGGSADSKNAVEVAQRALLSEGVAWVDAYGSPDLRTDMRRSNKFEGLERFFSPRALHASLLPGEFLEKNRPGWVLWEPLSNQERSQMEDERASDSRLNFSEPERICRDQLMRPESRTTPVIEMLSAARRMEPDAELAVFHDFDKWPDPGDEPGSWSRVQRYCAIAQIRIPGQMSASRIVFHEDLQQQRKLDEIASVNSRLSVYEHSYAEKLARAAEVEFGRPARILGDHEVVRGTLARIDVEPESGIQRAIVVGDRATYLLQTTEQPAHDTARIGERVTLQRDSGHVLILPTKPVPEPPKNPLENAPRTAGTALKTLDVSELSARTLERELPINKLIRSVERERQCVVRRVPHNEPIVAQLLRVERGEDHRARAVLVTGHDAYVVGVLPAQVERLAHFHGQDMKVRKTAGRVRIVPAVLKERALAPTAPKNDLTLVLHPSTAGRRR